MGKSLSQELKMVRKRPAKFLSELSLDDVDNLEVVEEETKKPPDFESAMKTSELSDVVDTSSVQNFASESMLDEAEKAFYLSRRATYQEEFNLNRSSDLGIIHRIVMEEIITERLYRQMLENPQRDFSEQITESHARYTKALDSLGASRDKRIKNRETQSVSIADVSKSYYEGGRKDNFTVVKEIRDAEETALQREKDHALSLEYGLIESGGVIDDPTDGD